VALPAKVILLFSFLFRFIFSHGALLVNFSSSARVPQMGLENNPRCFIFTASLKEGEIYMAQKMTLGRFLRRGGRKKAFASLVLYRKQYLSGKPQRAGKRLDFSSPIQGKVRTICLFFGD
jgi:hypothetical protein